MDIYVGNLPYSASDADLRTLFESYGQVASARVVMDRFSGQSRGFGFVEMPERNEALSAIEKTNGADFMGRRLRVNESQPKPRREGNDFGGRRGGGGGDNDRRW
ncbi:MAG: RNA-binding protein [Lentisphaerae bacterium]|nr:RNA-binding protein [Lentisphaerota bacterium]